MQNTKALTYKSLLILFLSLISLGINAQKLTVTPSTVNAKAGEPFEVSYSINNVQNGQFNPPTFIDELRVVSGPNQYSSMQWINGKMSSNLRYSYTLMPMKKGTYNLKGASYKVGRKNYTAPSLRVTVTGELSQSQAKGSGSTKMPNATPGAKSDANANNLPDYFFRIEIDTNKVYQGQQLTAYYVIYSTYDLTNYNALEAPSFQGFWVQDITPDRITPQNAVIGEKIYTKYTLKKYALFPQKTGDLELDPMEVETTVRIPSGQRRGFFQSYTNKRAKLKTETVKVGVYPLPQQGKPNDFGGLVGNFKLNVRPNKTTTKVGESVNLNVSVIGSGNLKLVDPFVLDLTEGDFEVYDPTVNENIYSKNNIVMGSKSFEYLLIPQKEGDLQIPSLNYTYYNPATERYEVKNAPAVTIKVLPSDAAPIQEDEPKEAVDILDIHTGSTQLAKGGSSPLPYLLMGGLYLLPFLALPILLSRKRKEDEENADVLGRKRRAALGVAQKRLEAANAFKSQNQKKPFYDEIIKTIWGYLGDRVNIPTSELSKANIQSVLSAKNVSDTNSQKLTKIIEYCEMALFAPVADADNLQKTYDETLNVIADIEEELK